MAPNTSQSEEIERDLKLSLRAGRKLASAPRGEEICITGISGTFPDSNSVLELQQNLYSKKDLVTADHGRWTLVHPELPSRLGRVLDVQKFDASFFGIHYQQAECMDPMGRILLEKAFEAIIDAGMNPAELRGTRVGVFIGACYSESEKSTFYELSPSHGFGITGCSRTMLANRISYWLGVNGPSYTVDSACSSSLYALEHAYRAIRNGVCDQALVGGANLTLEPLISLQFSRLGVLSIQGRCKTFDAEADGYARSETIGMLLLQKAKDSRRVYAKVVHAKTNCDGYKTEGITFPSSAMQQKLLEEFYQECQIDPASVAWIEAHGTGTKVGDPEELNAVDRVFCKGRTTPLPIGSVKSNLGHTEPASGFCAISKVVIAMENLCIPPNINFDKPKDEVPALMTGALQVVTEPQPWKGGLVGINSFGFGGANCHTLLDSNPKNKINGGAPQDDIPRLVTISGRTHKTVQQIFNDLQSRPVDAEYVNLYHRIHAYNIPGHSFRGYILLMEDKPLSSMQRYSGKCPPVWFVMSGLDSQWMGMGKSLLAIPLFAAAIDRCHETLKPLGVDLKTVLTEDNFDNLIHSHVGITAIQIGLLDILSTVGIHADGLIGLSVGELAAGYADKCLTLEQTILAAYYQGLSLLELDSVKGSMACIGVGAKEATAMLPLDVEVACKNENGNCIISGPSKSVATVLKSLRSKGIFAKELKCNNIAVHSHCIKNVGSKLTNYLKKIIPSPKLRSKKWVSTSVPQSERSRESAKFASAEYLTNSLLCPVLFENAQAHIPQNAIVIEVSPDNTLHRTLSQLGGKGSVSLMDSRHDATQHLLLTLGKLFTCGLQPQLANLYPPVAYPVSRTTPMISHLIDWEHSHNWHVLKHRKLDDFKSGERDFIITLASEEMAFYTGHVIDGRNLFPATGYLEFVWEFFAIMNNSTKLNLPVVFEKVRFHRATTIPSKGKIMFTVSINMRSGNFEVVEGETAVVSGRVANVPNNIAKEMVSLPLTRPPQDPDAIDMSAKDVYKELRLRGYNYSGIFRSIVSADSRGFTGKIRWQGNWVAFMDNMLQMQILTEDTRGLFVPTAINKLVIDVVEHKAVVAALGESEDTELEVFVNREVDIIHSGGIQIQGLMASVIARRKPLGDPVIEKYLFMPNTNSSCKKTGPMDVLEALRICIHVMLENKMDIKVKAVEVVDSYTACERKMPVLAQGVASILGDLPLIQANITVLADTNCPLVSDLDSAITVEDTKLSPEENALFVIGTNLLNRKDILQVAFDCVGASGYLISREKLKVPTTREAGLEVLNEYVMEDEKIVLFQKKKSMNDPIVLNISESSFGWIPQLQSILNDESSSQKVVLFSQGEARNGLMGLFNCLRKEPGGQRLRCFLILDERAPPFDPLKPFYQEQMKKDLAVNVFNHGYWGSYRHMAMQPCKSISAKHAYINIETRGDLSTLNWLEGTLDPENYKPKEHETVVHIYFAALNFRDVMSATGKLGVQDFIKDRIFQDNVQGLEFAGRDSTGRRVMGEVLFGAMATSVIADSALLWEVPDEWTLEDAATVPIVYGTVYYALYLSGKMKKGDSILIHAGSGGIGQAAIQLALHEGCTVFTTVGTQEKRDFIKQRFPQITDRHIGNSRDTSFEQLVMAETNGRGVDLVLNSLAEEKLQASVRCLAVGGQFFEIGKFDLSNNNPLGMEMFSKETSFHGVMLDSLIQCEAELKKPLFDLMTKGIKEGAVQPLTRTVFADDEAEKAFRYMAAGKHIGKVLLKIREPEEDLLIPPQVLYHEAKPRFSCNPEGTYVIAGGLGGFGLELADWLVLRGAHKLVLTSRSGLKTGYQSSRVYRWRSYGVTVHIATEDITTVKGVTALLKEANKLGPVMAIFNLAVVLVDALFQNQTEKSFKKSFSPKADATKHFDVISRKLCPQLKYFVIFSSVSCGRGNAGQTNYGMANSVMERICEQRVSEGYPGLAVQWGAVGDVGLVAEMQDKDLELVIGGTLQQKISSCLKVLDEFLHQTHPVVASMVVAEKNASGNSGNLVDCILNIIGLRDLKTVSLHSTLAELGMDSMMAVEIKQTVEREFELFLTPQDIRALTFSRLIDLANTNTADSKKPSNETNLDTLQYMLRSIGNEQDASEAAIVLPSLATDDSAGDMFFIPGIEGMAVVFKSLAEKMKHKTTGLQLRYFADRLTEDPSQLASELLPFVQKRLGSNSEPFRLVAHSFGGLVAMYLTLMLEQAGYRGKLILLDSAPDFLLELIKGQIGTDGRDDTLQINLLIYILTLLKNQDAAYFEQEKLYLTKLQTWEERVEHAGTIVPGSDNYQKAIARLVMKRIQATLNFQWPKGVMLKSSVSLIRPTQQVVHMIEDYGLKKYCENIVDVHVVAGNHATILESPLTANIITILTDSFERDFRQNKSGIQASQTSPVKTS